MRFMADLSRQGFRDLAKELRRLVFNRWKKEGKRTFIFFYFGGHGVNDDGNLYAICNSEDVSQMSFPLDQFLRSIGKMDGAYVLAVLDCCREKMPELILESFMSAGRQES